MRYVNLFFILAVLIAAAALYDMKIAAERTSEQISTLQQKINDEQESIRLLTAEWSVLNQPSRLQALVERYNDYLQLAPLEPRQIVRLNDIPAKPTPAPAPDGSPLMAESAPLYTGAIPSKR